MSTDRRIDAEEVVHIYNEILAIKSNEIVQFAQTWIDLETVIQSEACQKEKNEYCIILLIYGIQKNATDELICKAKIEIQAQRMDVWIQGGPKVEG